MNFLQREKQKGFTLLEMILVVALIALISRLTFTSFSALNNRQTLDKEVDNIKSILQKTRLESLNAKNGNTHGINFASTSLTTVESASTTSNTYTFTNGVSLSINDLRQVSNGSATGSIAFAKITGLANATGTLVYVLKSGSTNLATRTITINALGTVE